MQNNLINPKTNEILAEYPSCASVKEDGYSPNNVNQVCNNKKKTHKKFKWCFIKDYEKIK